MKYRVAPPPHLFLNVLKTESGGTGRWIGARDIQRRIGGTSRSIQITADSLLASGKIERAWNVTQWEYRQK